MPGILRHQKYNYGDLLKDLNISYGQSLFDVSHHAIIDG
jgi:hypothetical protein